MVHMGHINETTTLCLTKEKECSQATSYDNVLGYINNILSGPEEALVDTKRVEEKRYVKPFQKERLELDNGLTLY